MSDTPPTSPRLTSQDPKRTPRPRPQYGTTHQKLRAVLLTRFPICQVCENAWAVEAHHRTYPALSVDDYLAVCVPCHRRIEREKDRPPI